jgi:FHS family L-fucose permease-like MFS transporter
MKKSIFTSPKGKSYLLPFMLITSLFMMWGLANGMLDVLNKHFQLAFQMSKAQSGLVQFSTYIAYGIMSVPAGLFMKKFGYKRGILSGLTLYAIGAFGFIPAAFLHSPQPFLLALFILACGLCMLETAANPYSTVLGPQEFAAQRINLSQSFNGLGLILGPLIGGKLILGADPGDSMALSKPYIILGIIVLVIAVLFFLTKLPDIKEKNEVPDQPDSTNAVVKDSMWKHRHFVLAVIAQFLYVAAQTGVFSLFINYVTEYDTSISPEKASFYLAIGGMTLFMIGRLSGSYIMGKMAANKVLATYAIASALMMLLVIFPFGIVSLVALCATFFFMSIMFPTIFALGLTKMGVHTKRAASFIVMGVMGGAFSPILMGLLGEKNMAIGFIIPLVCFAYIAYFGLKGYKVEAAE